MNTKESLKRFEEIAYEYLRELDRFSMEQLTRKQGEDEWSLGQMYLHLINSALYMQLRNVEACRNQVQQNIVAAGEKTEEGKKVFARGSFPPIKIRVSPSKEYTPPEPESKEQIVNGLKMVIHRMREIEPTLNDIPPSHTVPHPGFGALNATEWYTLVEMHYRHHLHQKVSLEASL